GFADQWFERGRLEVLSGASAGMSVMVKADRLTDTGRVLDLWHGTGAALVAGDTIRLIAGCDRRATTCQTKFANFLNFRGFPHVPGEDYLTSYPVSGGVHDGGSLQG
ncbi:MAG: phage BR0599 family protein, partial [Paracoccaceae bacterium]